MAGKIYPEIARRLARPIPPRRKWLTRQEHRRMVREAEWKELRRYPHPGTRQARRAELARRLAA